MLISYISNKDYKQKSSVELRFISLLISYAFDKEHKVSVELLVHFLTDSEHSQMDNISRNALWSSWLISVLISHTSNKEHKEKSSMELLVHFLTDSIHFSKEYKQKSSAELLVDFLTDFMHC